MGGIYLFYLIQSIFLFCFIFWGLTWGGEYFLRKKENETKKNFYECGFKATVDVNITTSLNFILFCIFLVLYDVEFLFLIPIYFNLEFISLFHFFILSVFVLLILVSLLYDWQLGALNWTK